MRKKTPVLGITGSFGSGKSTCAGLFKTLGASLVDADRIYHRLIRPSEPLYKKIVSFFGKEILSKTEEINRKILAKIIFTENAKLKKIMQLTHPAIIQQMRTKIIQLKRASRTKVIVVDAPLLIEANLLNLVDVLIVVKLDQKKQIARCKRRWGISGLAAKQRIKNQLSSRKKIELADYVINNNSTIKQTKKQVKAIWKEILRNPLA